MQVGFTYGCIIRTIASRQARAHNGTGSAPGPEASERGRLANGPAAAQGSVSVGYSQSTRRLPGF